MKSKCDLSGFSIEAADPVDMNSSRVHLSLYLSTNLKVENMKPPSGQRRSSETPPHTFDRPGSPR